MSTCADDLVAAVLARLEASKPVGLTTLLDHPELPLEPSELPTVGVYLTNGEQFKADPSSSGSSERTAQVRVEIRAMGTQPLVATKAFRDWVISEVFTDDTFGGRALFCEYQGFIPFGAVQDEWMGGALLDFEFTYDWSPHA